MELDHLDPVHVGSGQLAEAHEEHGADGEVRRHDGVGRRLGEELRRRTELGLAEAGRAHTACMPSRA